MLGFFREAGIMRLEVTFESAFRQVLQALSGAQHSGGLLLTQNENQDQKPDQNKSYVQTPAQVDVPADVQERRLRVRQLLQDLRAELSGTDTLDEETRELAQRLDKEIDTLIETSEPNSPLLDDAVSLSARFAATHPVAERITRELVSALGRMGI